MYVKDSYQTVGIINLITNVAIILFSFLYGKIINGKKNYLFASIILFVIVYFVKVNTTSYILILISFLEGIFSKMYEISVNKEFYTLSKKIDYENYNFAYECIQNSFRSFVALIIFVFTINFKVMIYLILLVILLVVFIISTDTQIEK